MNESSYVSKELIAEIHAASMNHTMQFRSSYFKAIIGHGVSEDPKQQVIENFQFEAALTVMRLEALEEALHKHYSVDVKGLDHEELLRAIQK